ncbi:hypothetical protein D3C73_1477470 [compost metagenome]
MPTEVMPTVITPANGPGPDTRMNIRPYTRAGIVRIKISSMRVSQASHFGTMFEAARKASGIDRTAPTIVPRNAIATVSSSKYRTLCFETLNSRSTSG